MDIIDSFDTIITEDDLCGYEEDIMDDLVHHLSDDTTEYNDDFYDNFEKECIEEQI